MRIIVFLSAIICAATTTDAESLCQDMSGFDQTEPRSIGASIDNTFAKFSWSSDVDVHDNRSNLWNYVFNDEEKKGWNGEWKKGGIYQPLERPLAPKKYACFRNYLGKHKADADAKRVATAEYRIKLDNCLNGNYAALCNH